MTGAAGAGGDGGWVGRLDKRCGSTELSGKFPFLDSRHPGEGKRSRRARIGRLGTNKVQPPDLT